MWTKGLIGLLIGRIATTLIASSMSVAIGWHLYQATGDAFDLALVGLFHVLPILTLSLVAGWVADNFSRKLILLCTATTQSLVMIIVALVMSSDELNKWALFASLFIMGVARTFFSPAIQSILPNLVATEHVNRAVALISSSWNLALMIGPFIAGMLIGWVDTQLYWYLLVFSIFTLGGFAMLPRLPKLAAGKMTVAVLLGGVHYLRSNRVVLGAMSVDLFIVLGGSVLALLPIFVTDVLNAGPEALGLLRAMPAIGATIMGVWLTKRKSNFSHAGKALFSALIVFTCSIFVFAVSKSVTMAAVALFIYGASDMVSVIIRNAIVQVWTPDELRGRVSAVNSLFIASSNELGDFRAGLMASLLGPVGASLVGGVFAIGVVGASAVLFKPLMLIKKIDK